MWLSWCSSKITKIMYSSTYQHVEKDVEIRIWRPSGSLNCVDVGLTTGL